ncbi:MAG TPA: riboflavin synthase [Flavobacteriales bacterium]|nr:riboflavin synthase [Flavobacteriales bacterium]
MFTGIVEEVGEVVEVRDIGGNKDLVIRAAMTPELRVDQSVSHNGVCLTVVEVSAALDLTPSATSALIPSAAPDRTPSGAVGLPPGCYRVTAVQETLERSNIGRLKAGDGVNLERSLRVGDRLDGHMVQGHVDTMVTCTGVEERDGSWWFTFALPGQRELLVEKGSICLNGVSLTIAALDASSFSVAVIPYTYGHTIFRNLRPGDAVNVEYDVLGKYVARMVAARITP